MKISTKGRYALRLMIDLAIHDSGELIPLKEIAQRQDITLKYMEQLITPLSRAGFVTSLRGANGGYRLTRRPDEYKVGDILRVMEGPLSPVACLDPGAPECPRSDGCATLPFWKGLSEVVNRYVDSFTLEDLKNQSLEQQIEYVI